MLVHRVEQKSAVQGLIAFSVTHYASCLYIMVKCYMRMPQPAGAQKVTTVAPAQAPKAVQPLLCILLSSYRDLFLKVVHHTNGFPVLDMACLYLVI